MEVDILALGAHPDDVEISCCGTLLHHVYLGYKIGIIDLTSGELGTRGHAALRLEEANAASSKIGAVVRGNLEMADAFFEYKQTNVLKVIEMLRLFRPRIVLASAISDRHPDHGRAAKLVADACFYAGLPKIKTVWNEQAQTAWRPNVVYHYIQDYNLAPDFVMDISSYIDRKIEIIKTYQSQFYNPHSTEPNTPISGKDFLEFVRSKNRTYGRAAGFEYAEGFRVNRTIGVNNLFQLF